MKTKQQYYSLRSFGSFLTQYKLKFGITFFWFIVANALLAIIPLFIGKLVGALAANPIDNSQVFTYVGILIACSVGHDITWHISEFTFMKLLKPIGFLYENIAFSQVLKRPYPYFVDKFTGKISSYVETLGQELRTLIENICFSYVGGVVRLVAVAAILTSVNIYTGLIFCATILLMFCVGRYTVKNSTRYEKQFTDTHSTKTGKIVDVIANFINVKSFQKEDKEIKSLEIEQNKTINAAMDAFFWDVIFWGSMGFIVRNILWPIAIILNVYLFLQNQISLEELATFLSAIFLFSEFIWEVIWHAAQFNIKLARFEEAHVYLFGKTNIVQLQQQNHSNLKPAVRQFNQNLVLENLDFAYPDRSDVTVLSTINLSIISGEKVGIVGKSGSGKTTLTKILLDYYPDENYKIMIDGQMVTTSDVSNLIAYVPQDTSLFHRTIAENIAYAADREVSREEIITAAKQAHADEFISQIREGYDAVVGERGVKLSAGQRQRLAIARAFLDDKPILVLDEATSALDSGSEILVQEALEALWENKTVIAIAHRLSTLRHMNRIIVMDRGKIIEQGTHKELLNLNGKYAELWNHQSGGFIEE